MRWCRRSSSKGKSELPRSFFNTPKPAEQRRLLQAPLPLSFGFALTITDSRAKSVSKGKKSQRKGSPASAVLWLVRAARDALLRGKVDELLTDGGRLMMSLMRLGILRTTAGVAEADEAVRARSTKLE